MGSGSISPTILVYSAIGISKQILKLNMFKLGAVEFTRQDLPTHGSYLSKFSNTNLKDILTYELCFEMPHKLKTVGNRNSAEVIGLFIVTILYKRFIILNKYIDP